MAPSRLLLITLGSCLVLSACGGGDTPGDVTDDQLSDTAQLDALADHGGSDLGDDIVQDDVTDDTTVETDADAAEDAAGDVPEDAVGTDVPEVYTDTLENQMDTFFEGIRAECRPVDLGCAGDDDCAEGLHCIARGCVASGTPEGYAFAPNMYHVTSMVLPTADTPTGFDLNGDGVPDNKLAFEIGLLPGGTLRFNSILSDFTRTGVFNLMIELRDMPGDGCGPLTLALHPATSDLDLDGLPDGGDFQVRQDSFRTDGLGPVAQINSVAIDGDLLRSGPGVELPLKVPLTDGTVLTLPLEGFRVEMIVPAAGGSTGAAPRSLALALPDAPPDTNAVIGGYIRLSRVVDEVNVQGKDCACAGIDPSAPLASFHVEDGVATAACDQPFDTGPCDWSADGRFCPALDAVCLAINLMVLEMDVTSGMTKNDDDESIPDALSLALYLSVTPSDLFEPPLAPDFAAAADTWRMSPDCDVLQDDGPTRIGVLGNDHYLLNDTPEITSVDLTDTDGAVTIIADGTQVVYTPNAGFWGFDSFTYTIEDGNGNQSTAPVSMRVSPATWYDPNMTIDAFCNQWCQQYEICYPDDYPAVFTGGDDQCIGECHDRFSDIWTGTSPCTLAQKQQDICRAALPCFRVPEFDEAMAILAAGGETEDYHCEDQVWARLDACGTCAPGTWGENCDPCPVTISGPPCDGNGICSDGSDGDGACACNEGFENDLENGSCRLESICYPDPCTVTNAIPQSCYPMTDQQQNETYGCSCENNTFWDINAHVCFDWCDPNPCLADPNSDGTCMAMSLDYYCGCVEAYYYDLQMKLCLPM